MLGLCLSKFRKANASQTSKQAQWQTSEIDDGEEDYGTNPNVGRSIRGNQTVDGPCRLFTQNDEKDDKLVAVVVTIFSGASYDEMFRENQPATVPGERVSTYSLDCSEVGQLQQHLSGSPLVFASESWRQLVEDINRVTPDSVTFNWECCSGCGNDSFPTSRVGTIDRQTRLSGMFSRSCGNQTMQIIGLALRRGFTVMCSDFSLKALISEWSEAELGPNPFVKIGHCDQSIELGFSSAELQHEEVPQQLQVVGELCAEQGKAIVSAMSDTIVYTVNPRRTPTDVYSLKVLTVATKCGGMDYVGRQSSSCNGDVEEDDLGGSLAGQTSWPEAMMCSVGEGDNVKRGMAAHVTLTYSSGGQLVTSMGHWIELSRIDTSLDSILRVAEHNFGMQEMSLLQADMNMQDTDFQREACVQKWAKKHISQSVPTRMKCRTKY